MKHVFKSTRLSAVAAGFGLIGLVLRRMLYAFGVDAQGLLIKHHPLALALWLLTAAAMVTFLLIGRKLREHPADPGYLPEGNQAAVGHFAGALGIGVTMLTQQPRMPGGLGQAWLILGFGAPVCLALAGLNLRNGKKPLFLLHLIPCLFLLVHIVNHYQMWSADPQLMDYVFMLFGSIALMLFAFHTASVEAGMGGGQRQRLMGSAAVYLLLTELATGMYPWLYLGGIVWAATSLYEPEPEKEEKKEM